jgi:RimJ/RimL family protein N-acetyltransferase
VIAGTRASEQGPVELTCFLDPSRNLPGWGLEAYVLYGRALQDAGITRLRIGVLGGDRVARSILHRLSQEPTATLREHEWGAGAFHDVLVFELGEAARASIDARLSALLKLGPARSMGEVHP